MIAVGYDHDHNQVVRIPIPGEGGAHVLIGGSSGGGKSRLLHAMLCQLAPMEHTALVISDPAVMEFEPLWGPRASCIALGRQGASWLLERLEEELRRRLQAGRRMNVRLLPVSAEWPRIVVVVDELAMLTLGGPRDATNRLIDLAQVGRKVRIGLVLATQSPKASVVPMLCREQMAVRIALRTAEPEQTDCILGTQRVPAHHLPHDQPGRAWVLTTSGEHVQVRCPMVTDDEITATVQRTQHLTPLLDRDHGWRPVYDPYQEEEA